MLAFLNRDDFNQPIMPPRRSRKPPKRTVETLRDRARGIKKDSGLPQNLWVRKYEFLFSVATGGSPTVDPGDIDVQRLAEIDSRIVQALVGGGGPQIELVSVRFRLEATERVLAQIRRKRATLWGRRAMDRTAPSHLIARTLAGTKPSKSRTCGIEISDRTARKSTPATDSHPETEKRNRYWFCGDDKNRASRRL